MSLPSSPNPRLTPQETTDKPNEYRARLRLEGDGAPVEAAATFTFTLEEVITLVRLIGDQMVEAQAAFNLGHAYSGLPAVRDLDAAERWYRRSLELHAEGDRSGRAQCLGQLGSVATSASWKRGRRIGRKRSCYNTSTPPWITTTRRWPCFRPTP